MAKGLLVKILLHTKTTHYLDFAKIDGSFVMAKARVSKVPATAAEALSSNLMVRATACAQVPQPPTALYRCRACSKRGA